MIDIILSGLIGLILGLFIGLERRGPGWTESEQYYEKYRQELHKHQEDLRYYKKLCRTLADENAEFRRNQKTKS